MSHPSHVIKRATLSTGPTRRQPFTLTRRWLSTVDDVIREGDVVILRRIKKPTLLLKPLKHGDSIGTNFGTIQHDAIIGKSYRDTVKSSQHKYARIHRPTLGEYTTLTPRLVTPVYPADANLIVSLLDIHVDAPRPDAEQNDTLLEILEAGTGHGALTLHLARAIHAANPPRPKATESQDDDGAWRKTRQAVVHTLDISRDHSFHARKVVNGFRNGLYAGNVDFHIGSLDHFINAECERRGVNGMMFHHILLDLPGTHHYIMKAAQALKPDGVLIVFSPSVTQIAQCVEVIRKNKLPLSYDQVVELGAGYGGGKQWDVRLVTPRKSRPQTVIEEQRPKSASGFFGFLNRIFGRSQADQAAKPEFIDEPDYTVCRPLVRHRVVGGGFVGVWRRKKDWEKFDEEDEDSTT